MTNVPDPYGHAQFHGKPGDNATIQMLKEAERRLGYELSIFQFIGGAAASGGTHLEGRMADLSTFDAKNKLKVIDDLGGFGWVRPFVPGLWAAHIHVGCIYESRSNTKGIAPAGFRQIAMWDAGRDGLKSNLSDSSYRPSPKRVWSKEDYENTVKFDALKPTNVQLLRNSLVEAIQDLAEGLVHLSEVQANRIVVHAQAEPIVEERRRLKAILAKLPPR